MKNNYDKMIILDNGHGIETPGKRSPDGLFREYKWCRDFVKRLKLELEEWGYNVTILVPEDHDVRLSSRATRANNICKEYGIQNCILISIHNNAAGNGEEWYNATGWEAYTTHNKTKSDKLADLLYQEINLQDIKTRTDLSDGDYDKESNFTILYKTYCPAVITENMFMDSKEDVEFLNSETGILKLLKAHVAAIRRYFEDCYGTHDSWINDNQNWEKYWNIKNKNV